MGILVKLPKLDQKNSILTADGSRMTMLLFILTELSTSPAQADPLYCMKDLSFMSSF